MVKTVPPAFDPDDGVIEVTVKEKAKAADPETTALPPV
jgi:hypothetical protein